MKANGKSHDKMGVVKLGRNIRLLCGVLCMLLVLVTAAGCTSFVKVEELLAVSAERDTVMAELEALKNSYNQAIQDIECLRNDIAQANGKIEELEASNQAANEEIESLKDKNAEAKAEIESLEKINEEAQKEIETLKERLEEVISAKKIKIYIDQGHNPTEYHNSGESGNGLHEEDLTYNIGILLADMLEKDGRFEVCLSRPSVDTVLGEDNSSSLDARVQGAKDFGADYFISLHTNWDYNSSVGGTEVYVAERGSKSYTLGSNILEGILKSTNLKDRGMKIDSEFRVLKNADVPAVLVEMGFISNSAEAALLSESPELFAKGIFNGILVYFELV